MTKNIQSRRTLAGEGGEASFREGIIEGRGGDDLQRRSKEKQKEEAADQPHGEGRNLSVSTKKKSKGQ